MVRTDAWQQGDPVSLDFNGHVLAGTAVVFSRSSDGQRFVTVRITSGPKAGTQVWVSDGWRLGQGRHEHACIDCGYAYRSDDPSRGFCPACDGAATARPNDAHAPVSPSVRWRHEDRAQGRRR